MPNARPVVKLLVVYNRYRHRVHGEEFVVENTNRLLRERGAEVAMFTRSSEGLEHSRWDQIRAGAASIYNPVTRRQLAAALQAHRPDVVHVHNLYPWISPSALVAARDAGIPVVMTVHHYGMTCPVLTHYRDGHPCVACPTHGVARCVLNNCRHSIGQSTIYAIRSAVAQHMRWFTDDVTTYIALSEFAKAQLVGAGFASERIAVRPNMINMTPAMPPADFDRSGDYVAYVGRLTVEKGVDLLCDASAIAGLPLRIAGDATHWPGARSPPQAVSYQGVLLGEQLHDFYRGARFIVVPSRWWEVCPLVVLEAMNLGVPVIAARIGGLPEMVSDGVTGLLFTAGNSNDLARQMLHLWHNPEMRQRFARAGRQRLEEKYGAGPYVDDLLTIYSRAVQLTAARGLTA